MLYVLYKVAQSTVVASVLPADFIVEYRVLGEKPELVPEGELLATKEEFDVLYAKNDEKLTAFRKAQVAAETVAKYQDLERRKAEHEASEALRKEFEEFKAWKASQLSSG